MRINHNLSALNAWRQLKNNDAGLNKSLERLSSGLRINRAADDAAGLAISEKMRAQINGLNQATRNAQDGISLIQTAEGALNETHGIIQRMRELAQQAANDTLTSSDRIEIQKEVDQLKAEIDRIANTTEFNTKKLLDGTASAQVSSDLPTTEVITRGSVAGASGQYKMDIQATAGEAQIQSSAQMRFLEGDGLKDVTINADAGLDESADVTATNLLNGDYEVTFSGYSADATSDATISLSQVYQQNTENGHGVLNSFEVTPSATANATIAFEVLSVDTATDTLNVRITSHQYEQDGTYTQIDITRDLTADDSTDVTMAIGDVNVTLQAGASEQYTVGDKWVMSVTAAVDDAGMATADQTMHLTGPSGTRRDFVFNNDVMETEDQAMKTYYLDGDGRLLDSSVTLDLGTVAESPTTDDLLAGGTGITRVDGSNLISGKNYEVEIDYEVAAATASATKLFEYSQSGETLVSGGSNVTSSTTVNGDILFEVIGVDTAAGTVELRTTSQTVGIDGTSDRYEATATITVTAGGTVTISADISAGATWEFENVTLADAEHFTVGDKFVYHVESATAATSDSTFTLYDGGYTADSTVSRDLTLGTATGTLQQGIFTLDEETGLVTESTLRFTFGATLTADATTTDRLRFSTTDAAASFSWGSVEGEVANDTATLADIARFYDSEGNFMVDEPTTIELVQGDGQRTKVTLFETDTLADVASKLNDAIKDGLGQGDIVSSGDDQFVKYVTSPTDATVEGTEGSFVLRSAITGGDGEITIVGNDEVLSALGLTTVQEAEENTFNIDITDVTTGEAVHEDVEINGNTLVGQIHENIDVSFANMTGLKVTFDSATKEFTFAGGQTNAESTTIHIAERSTSLQVGANAGQSVNTSIGQMDTAALGIDKILVTNIDAANRAIESLDTALARVSAQRSELGSVQNRLEHTIANLGVAAENLTAAESRIRDVDMAKEMLEFTKNQILSQAGTAMLAQANTRPQSVLQLLG